MTRLILEVIHGSHLYGLDTPQSDLDLYQVYSGDVRSGQRISNGVDNTYHSLNTFLYHCNKGVPQALEAMFATQADTIYSELDIIRNKYYANSTQATQTYIRTIRNHALRGTPKAHRHALRLGLNLSTLEKYGRFNPRLSELEKRFIENSLDSKNAELFKTLNTITGYRIFNL